MQIIVQTPRLIVREFNPDEVELLVNLYHDEEINRYVTKRTDAEHRQKFAAALQEYQHTPGLGRWGVFDATNQDFIGVCILKPADSDPARIELGYVLAQKYWGKGLATELTKALVTYGFEQKSLAEICACTDAENVPSQNVLLKAGLLREGNVMWHGSDLLFFRISRDQ